MQSECNHRVYKQDKIYPVYYSGRTVTQYGGKTAVLLLSVAVASVLLSAVEGYCLSKQLPFEYWAYSARGIVIMTNCTAELSIGSLFIQTQLIKLVGSIFIASVAILISELFKSYAASVFSLVTVQIVVDYVGNRSNLSYLLPTGAMRGYGYFYGDVMPTAENNYMQFSGVPLWYTAVLMCGLLIFLWQLVQERFFPAITD